MPKVLSETIYLTKEKEEFNLTLEQEKAYIESVVKNPRSCLFVVEEDKKIIGSLGFTGSNLKRKRHTGSFGVSILKEYWGRGIASRLLEKLFSWANENEITKINLKVVDTNKRAIKLYEKYGFVVEGKEDRAVKINSEYYSYVLMGKNL